MNVYAIFCSWECSCGGLHARPHWWSESVGYACLLCYVLPLLSGKLRLQLLCCACIVLAVTGTFYYQCLIGTHGVCTACSILIAKDRHLSFRSYNFDHLYYKLQFTILSNGSINLLLEVKEVCFTHYNNFLWIQYIDKMLFFDVKYYIESCYFYVIINESLYTTTVMYITPCHFNYSFKVK